MGSLWQSIYVYRPFDPFCGSSECFAHGATLFPDDFGMTVIGGQSRMLDDLTMGSYNARTETNE